MTGSLFVGFFTNTLDLYLDAAPWLLIGLFAAGLVKAWVSNEALSRWMGGAGVGPVLKAALIGAPLPLCSCSAVPAALALRKAGASPGATVSFLVATPETGADSVAVTYALMGPFMALARPLAAIFSAITAGFFASRVNAPQRPLALETAPEACQANSCCGTQSAPSAPNLLRRTLEGLRYAFVDLLGDIALWMAVGLVLAGIIATLVPPEKLAVWGHSPLAYVAMLLAGIPMFICATASTPLAATLLVAGVSPGAVLVFLLAGPATNGATIALLKRHLGTRLVAAYLVGIASAAVLAGLTTDLLVDLFGIEIRPQLTNGTEGDHAITAWASALLLALLALAPPLRRRLAPTGIAAA